MDKELIKIETYKKVDLFYNEQDGRIYFNFEGRDLDVKYIFEAQRIIDEPVWTDCDLQGYFIDGTFHDYIGKAKATRKNIKNGKPEWKYKGKYDMDFKLPDRGGEKVYPFTKENSAIYLEYQNQNEIVIKEDRKLKQIINKLN